MLDNYSLLKKLEKTISDKFDEVKKENLSTAIRLIAPIVIMFTLREAEANSIKYSIITLCAFFILLTIKPIKESLQIEKISIGNRNSVIYDLEGFCSTHSKNFTELALWSNILNKAENENNLDLFIFVIKDEFEKICSCLRNVENALTTAKTLKDPLESELVTLSKDYYNAEIEIISRLLETLEDNKEKFTANKIFYDLKNLTSNFQKL